MSYIYPPNTDLCLAFTSLLHVNRTDLSTIFRKIEVSLRTVDKLYISLKKRPEYAEELQEDQVGKRIFYYNPRLIEQIAGLTFKKVFEDHHTTGNTDCFTIVLQKQKIGRLKMQLSGLAIMLLVRTGDRKNRIQSPSPFF